MFVVLLLISVFCLLESSCLEDWSVSLTLNCDLSNDFENQTDQDNPRMTNSIELANNGLKLVPRVPEVQGWSMANLKRKCFKIHFGALFSEK